MNYKYCPQCSRELEKREKFGRERLACPSYECGFVLFADPKVVAVVLLEKDGRLLLGRRNIEPAKGLWTFVGGYVDQGERVEEAALREVKEETNLDVELGELLGVYSQTGVAQILIVYLADIKAGSAGMQPQVEEVSELAFFPPDGLPELAFPGDGQIMRDWLARRNLVG